MSFQNNLNMNDGRVLATVHENQFHDNPTPDNFDKFLPWACSQMCVEFDIIIVSVLDTTYVSPGAQVLKKKQPLNPSLSTSENADVDNQKTGVPRENKTLVNKNLVTAGEYVKIYTVYDEAGNLIRLKFDKNKKIPSLLLKIISLILQYHTYLTGITINGGISNILLKEIKNFLELSNINDICLDNTLIVDANYDILLDNKSSLKNLSLSRCQIDDNAVRKIASKLTYPLPASKTLLILNLSSNKITNVGAKYLADALRSNRSLLHLNLADNLIADQGALAILDVLQEFLISDEEFSAYKIRYLAYVKEKLSSTMDEKLTIAEMQATTMMEDKKNVKRRTAKRSSLTMKSEATKKDPFMKSMTEEDYLKDPFSHSNVRHSTQSSLYCYGNNYLAYLNLSYNSVSYITVKHLLTVLTYQNTMDRKPKGLIKLCIEGNCIPDKCAELIQIKEILQRILSCGDKTLSIVSKKKQTVKKY